MDRGSFLGPSVAPEIQASLPILQNLPQPVARKLLPLILSYLSAPSHDNIPSLQVDVAALQKDVEPAFSATLPIVFTGLMYIMRLAVKSRVSLENFQANLQEINVPVPLITDLSTVLKKSRAPLETSALSNTLRFPTLSSLKWRVDVIISSSTVSRVLSPIVTVEVTSSDGKVRTFEVTIEKFHELRYNVAKVLKDMEEVEQLPILKIDK